MVPTQVISTSNTNRRWVIEYDGEYIWYSLEKKKKILFFNLWVKEYRKTGVKLIKDYKGSGIGVKIGFYQTYEYDLNSFNLRAYLDRQYVKLISMEIADRFTEEQIKKIFKNANQN